MRLTEECETKEERKREKGEREVRSKELCRLWVRVVVVCVARLCCFLFLHKATSEHGNGAGLNPNEKVPCRGGGCPKRVFSRV